MPIPSSPEHVTVFRAAGRYGGWPANYGIWSWPNPGAHGGTEIVVGFTVGYTDPNAGFHARDRNRPFESTQARSLDGGRTWAVSPMPFTRPGARGVSADEHMREGLRLSETIDRDSALGDCPGVDFTHPDFALMCARTGLKKGCSSFFYTSIDRCRTWDGPWRLPGFDRTGIAARTDYLIDDARTCTLFLTANKADGNEGRVICVRSTDGGRSFAFLADIGPEPPGFAIMPANLRVSPARILCAVRCRERKPDFQDAQNWIDLYGSDDNGASWSFLNRPVPATGVGGNPPTLMRLHDGRLCLTYGFRDAPYKMCARLSADDGFTWSEEVVLRSGGGNHDIGYPRTVQLSDGAIVTCYYWTDTPEGDRYIAATLWRP
jgi:hypothetical protein